jgi:magnesium-transporting ATPase (P-type)
MMVVMTARAFFLSRIMPRTPSTKAAGTENIMDSPARACIGLFQPPPKSMSRKIITGTTQRKAADIFPRRILVSLISVTIAHYYIGN